MAEANISDNSFYHAVSFLQRHSMKTDMVETSKVWRSSSRKLSCRIHLRYTLLSARHTHWRGHRHECREIHTLTCWQCIHSLLPTVVASVVFPHGITTAAWHVRAISCSQQRWGAERAKNMEKQSDRRALQGYSYILFHPALKSHNVFPLFNKCLYLIWLFLNHNKHAGHILKQQRT